jgi:large subunit ribosomal protein L6
MSRIGKLSISIPSGVTASVTGSTVSIKGSKGDLTKTFDSCVSIKLENDEITVSPADNSKFARAMWGTVRSIIASMVQGVAEGFTKQLEIEGVGFKASVSGSSLKLNLGYSHDINYAIPAGITITTPEATKITVTGADKHMVGQVAADIKHFYPVEPYKGKGVRIVGDFVFRKEGKTAA